MVIKGSNRPRLLQGNAYPIIFVALSLTIASVIPFAWADDVNPGVYSSESKPYGLT